MIPGSVVEEQAAEGIDGSGELELNSRHDQIGRTVAVYISHGDAADLIGELLAERLADDAARAREDRGCEIGREGRFTAEAQREEERHTDLVHDEC
jgi:hypothetical protein